MSFVKYHSEQERQDARKASQEKSRIKNKEKIYERYRLWYANNKVKAVECSKKYRLNHIEKVKQYQKQYSQKNRSLLSKIGKKHYETNYRGRRDKNIALMKKGVSELSDRYIKDRLRQKGFPPELFNNKELLETQRLIIKTKRLCKTSKN